MRQGQLEDLCDGKDVEVLSRKELGLKECQGQCAPFWNDNTRIKSLSELIASKGSRKATRDKLRPICKEHGLSTKGGKQKLQKRLIRHLCRHVHDKHRIVRDLNMTQIADLGFQSGILPHDK